MKIITPPDFYQIVKGKHILLDTNIFIDVLSNPKSFVDFLKKLKDNNTTIVTIDLVKVEFLQGVNNKGKYKEKDAIIKNIIDAVLPVDEVVIENCYVLIKKYKESGKPISPTDFMLGATIMRYSKNLFLLTKNTKDFPSNIFNVASVVNLVYKQGIQSYGLYSYLK